MIIVFAFSDVSKGFKWCLSKRREYLSSHFLFWIYFQINFCSSCKYFNSFFFNYLYDFIELLCLIIISTNHIWICLLFRIDTNSFLTFHSYFKFYFILEHCICFVFFFFRMLICYCRRHEFSTSQTHYKHERCIPREIMIKHSRY
jgi:hypothetical protein